MTTHPLPAEAVEAAAIGLFERLYVTDGKRHADYDAHWLVHGDVYRKEARAALLAAYPAIREAVVGELDKPRRELCALAAAIGGAGLTRRTLADERRWADKLLEIAQSLAALTEQENRNG